MTAPKLLSTQVFYMFAVNYIYLATWQLLGFSTVTITLPPPAILAPELTFRLALPGNSNPSCRRIQDGGGVRNTVVQSQNTHVCAPSSTSIVEGFVGIRGRCGIKKQEDREKVCLVYLRVLLHNNLIPGRCD